MYEAEIRWTMDEVVLVTTDELTRSASPCVALSTREVGALPPSLAGGHMVVVSVPLGAVGS